MNDLTPNDLSHLSDEEFLALCPQGEHAPGPEPLSPAAQAVSDAYENNLSSYIETGLIAALRALADQVVPLLKTPWGSTLVPLLTARECRDQILAIATELENAQ